MKVDIVSNNRNINFKSSASNSVLKQEEKSNFGTKELLLSLAGLAVLGTAGYFIFRGKSMPKSDKPNLHLTNSGQETNRENTADILNSIDVNSFSIDSFYEKFKTLKDGIVSELRGNRTKLSFSGTDIDGNELLDCMVFDKDKKLLIRFLRTKNIETGRMSMVTYTSDKTYSENVNEFLRDDTAGYKMKKIFAQSEFVPFKSEKISRFEQYAKVYNSEDDIKNYRRWYNQDKVMINLNIDNLPADDFNYKFNA